MARSESGGDEPSSDLSEKLTQQMRRSAEVAEKLERTERQAAEIHERIADSSDPERAERFREHARRANEMAEHEKAEAARLRAEADRRDRQAGAKPPEVPAASTDQTDEAADGV